MLANKLFFIVFAVLLLQIASAVPIGLELLNNNQNLSEEAGQKRNGLIQYKSLQDSLSSLVNILNQLKDDDIDDDIILDYNTMPEKKLGMLFRKQMKNSKSPFKANLEFLQNLM